MQLIIQSPIDKNIRLDFNYFYNYILQKHPTLSGKEKEIIRSIEDPFTVRRSIKDPDVFLYYAIYEDRLLCSVVKSNDFYSFLITVYPCDTVKIGEVLWQK